MMHFEAGMLKIVHRFKGFDTGRIATPAGQTLTLYTVTQGKM